MAGATAAPYVLPYPTDDDFVVNGDEAIQALADRLQIVLATIDPASSASPTGHRNVIRNGDMDVNQRGGGVWTTGGVYTIDGWVKQHVGGSHSQDTLANALGAGGGINGARISSRNTVASQSAAADYALIRQNIEWVRTLAGKVVTCSFVAYATAGTPKIGVEVLQHFGTGGSPSADVMTAGAAVTLSTVATRYSVTLTVPNIIGKTLGSATNDYLALVLWLSAGANNAARASSIGIQNSTIHITDVQLEAGASATPFERRPIAEQLLWCHRYFRRYLPQEVNGQVMGSDRAVFSMHGNEFRVVPTLTIVGMAMYIPYFGVAYTGTSYTLVNNSTRMIVWWMVVAGATMGGEVHKTILWNGTTLDLSAEL